MLVLRFVLGGHHCNRQGGLVELPSDFSDEILYPGASKQILRYGVVAAASPIIPRAPMAALLTIWSSLSLRMPISCEAAASRQNSPVISMSTTRSQASILW
jgi:hypothetical protein